MPMDEWELRLWIQRALDVIAASINEPMSPNFAGTVFAQHAAEPDGVKNLFVGMLNVATERIWLFQHGVGLLVKLLVARRGRACLGPGARESKR